MRLRNLAVLAVAGGLLAACPNPLQIGGGNSAAPPAPAGSAGPDRSAARIAIQRVLDEDNRAGTSSDDPRAIYTQMQRIDLSGTPDDFRTAYQAHLDAWRETSALVDEGVAMTNPDDMRRREWTDRVARADGRVSDTFTTVTRIAGQYGATAPASSGRSGLGGTTEGRGNAATAAPQSGQPATGDKPAN